jgi:hypothetical protein
MVRAGQSSEKAALIYQHSTVERQREVADGIDARVRADREAAAEKREDRDDRGDGGSGTQRARDA